MQPHLETGTGEAAERPALLASERSGFYVARVEPTPEPTTNSFWAWIWVVASLLAALISMAP